MELLVIGSHIGLTDDEGKNVTNRWTAAEALQLFVELQERIPYLLRAEQADRQPYHLLQEDEGLRCPHCQYLHERGRDDDGLTEVDAGTRQNDAAVAEDGAVYQTWEADRDFHTVAWTCGNCDGPVWVPPTVEVRY